MKTFKSKVAKELATYTQSRPGCSADISPRPEPLYSNAGSYTHTYIHRYIDTRVRIKEKASTAKKNQLWKSQLVGGLRFDLSTDILVIYAELLYHDIGSVLL